MSLTASENANTLRDPEVRRHFMAVLESDLSPADKYEKIASFFELVNQLTTEVAKTRVPDLKGEKTDVNLAVSRAAEELGRWKPQEILKSTEDSLQRAVKRITNSQHRDGGWGYAIEISNTWGTAHALLALMKARKLFPSLKYEWEHLIQRGFKWLQDYQASWNVGDMPPESVISVYDAAVAVRCLSEGGHYTFAAASHTIQRFVQSQNRDGGWDAHLSGAASKFPRGIWSEVGATSMVIQTLVAEPTQSYSEVVGEAVKWLLAVQNAGNDAGSWSAGSCRPGATRPDGEPSVTKTCDAIRALLAVSPKESTNNFKDVIKTAVGWIIKNEKLIRTEDGKVVGWGFDDSTQPIPDLDSTCLTLETLVSADESLLPMLTANATWLIKAQTNKPGSIEDGKWSTDHFRITLALMNYYDRIRQSPLFGASETSASTTSPAQQ
jgi:hypothetical protein